MRDKFDKLLDKPAEKFIKIFIEHNKNDKNLDKYTKGFKIAKPAIIAATIIVIMVSFVIAFKIICVPRSYGRYRMIPQPCSCRDSCALPYSKRRL